MHKRGDIAGARLAFARAVELSPSTPIYRFNLACAHARLGALDEAVALLRQLLFEDVTRFRALIQTDDDLARVRASPAMNELGDLWLSLAPDYLEAARRGVPMLYWRGHATTQVQVTTTLRPGVFVRDDRRFVALAQPEDRALAAVVDTALRRVVYVIGDVADCHNDFCPKSYGWGIAVYPWLAAASSARQLVRPREGTWFYTALVEPTDEGARMRASGMSAPLPWQRLSHDKIDRDARQGPPEGPWLRLDAAGALLGQPLAGFRRRGASLTLPDGRVVDLGPGHAGADVEALVLSPDNAAVIAVSNHMRCDCDTGRGAIARHAIARVDLKSGKSAPLTSGKNEGAAAFDRDGDLYVQTDGSLRIWPDQRLPDGLVLVVPHQPPSPCCGL